MKIEQPGQRLMVGFDDYVFSPHLEFLIQDLKIGGLILFARNLKNPEQIKKLCQDVQACAAAAGQPHLLIAIDQEGGTVARLKKPFTQFSKGAAGMQSDEDAAHFGRITAKELNSVGINMNMAPVLDIAPNMQSIMAARSFGSEPQIVASRGLEVIKNLRQGNIIATAKHFPGIGRTKIDSHFDLPSFNATRQDLENFELIPFQTAIANHVPAIMLSHIFYPRLDPDWPAGLSRRIAKDLLRHDMGFNGLIVTDDLDMGAVKKHYALDTVITRILDAEIDLALICHQGPDIENAVKIITKKLDASAELRLKHSQALNRIMKLKRRYHARIARSETACNQKVIIPAINAGNGRVV